MRIGESRRRAIADLDGRIEIRRRRGDVLDVVAVAAAETLS
jgi:hypothetical protein